MARRKSMLKMPFFKVKINKKTISNILGAGLFTAAFLVLLSFFNFFLPQEQGGRYLDLIRENLRARMGLAAIFTPVVLVLLAGHFISSKKLKISRLSLTGGTVFILFSLIGVMQAGSWGRLIYENLSSDFSGFGAMLILFISFFIGLILVFDTSIDTIIILLVDGIKALIAFLKQHVFRSSLGKAPEVKAKMPLKKENAFINEKKVPDAKIIPQVQPAVAQAKPIQTANAAANTPAGEREILMKPMTPMPTASTWVYPPVNLLADISQQEADRGDVKNNADIIEKTLDSFGIQARVYEVNKGPTVTQYALDITRGTKLSKITALGNDLALALAAPTGQVRIEAPIPGKALVGIEIPNIRPEIVTLKKLFSSPVFSKNPDPLLVPLGLDVSGVPQAASIGKMPHALVAGTTGSGKSVLLNAWISTFLFRTKPDDLRLILVDPKRVEMSLYNGIPHLLTEVIVEGEKIIKALRWTVGEMEARYKEFAKVGARNLEGFNSIPGVVKKPYIVFIIDELADLMIFAPGDAEELITRIAQMARATGIHLILATQRPSVDVITGLMKANIPTRVAFNVSSMIDSRVIIDMPGAEKLLGRGDMLFLPPDQAKPRRIQGPFITEKEVGQVVSFLRTQVPEVHYTEEVTEPDEENFVSAGAGGKAGGGATDPLFKEALDVIVQNNKASASFLQRRLSVGYSRAAKILDQLEAAGYIGPANASKPREILNRGGGTPVTAEINTEISQDTVEEQI